MNRNKFINPYKMFSSSMIPNWLLERKEISAGAKLCYARLAQYAGKNGECFPLQKTLAQELGVSPRTVRDYISELVVQGLIVSQQTGLTKPNRYFFLKHPWMSGFLNDRRNSSAPERQDSSSPERQHRDSRRESTKRGSKRF